MDVAVTGKYFSDFNRDETSGLVSKILAAALSFDLLHSSITTPGEVIDDRYTAGLSHGTHEPRATTTGGCRRPSSIRSLIVFCGAGVSAGMRVLDLGCGIGEVSLITARLVGPHGQVHGIDLDPAALEIARTRIRSAGHDHVTFEPVDLSDHSPSGPYDAVIGRHILIHTKRCSESAEKCDGDGAGRGPACVSRIRSLLVPARISRIATDVSSRGTNCRIFPPNCVKAKHRNSALLLNARGRVTSSGVSSGGDHGRWTTQSGL